MKTIVYNQKTHSVVSEIDHVALHNYIITKISTEFSNMVENCYYPKIAEIYKELLHRTNSTEKNLLEYSKQKYRQLELSKGLKKVKLLHDPFTTLLILITQDFLKYKDLAGAEATFHLFALRYYTNKLHIHTTPGRSKTHICNVSAFQTALERLSKNHMFVKQKTIPNSIIYYSRAVFKLYLRDLKTDNAEGLWNMIFRLRTSISQSMRSFFNKYYEVIEEDKMSKSEQGKQSDYDPTHETKLRAFINKIVTDICVYHKVDNEATNQASSIIKFNKRLSEEYAKKLANPTYSEKIETALYLLLKDVKDTSFIKNVSFFDYVKKQLSIKITKQPVYFKKLISEIHADIIKSLNLEKWYNNLSVQSQAISRNFIAYYLAFYIQKYI